MSILYKNANLFCSLSTIKIIKYFKIEVFILQKIKHAGLLILLTKSSSPAFFMGFI